MDNVFRCLTGKYRGMKLSLFERYFLFLPHCRETMTVNNSSHFPYQSCLMPNLSEETQLRVRDITNHFLIPLNILVAAMSFVCNALVIITVARTKSLQQPPVLMLCSLAVTDLLYAPYSLYRNIGILAHKHMCPETVSPENAALSALCLLATLGNLAAISSDRYLAVRKTMWYRIYGTKSRAVKMICVSWVFSALVVFMMYLSRKFQGTIPPVGQVASLLFYIICFFVICFSYLGLFCKKSEAEEILHVRAILKREKRMANTVGIILLALLVTFLPGLLFPLVLNVKGVIFHPFRPFYGFFLQLNGLLNPLLNFSRSKEMRRSLAKLLKRSRQLEPSTAASDAQGQQNQMQAVRTPTTMQQLTPEERNGPQQQANPYLHQAEKQQ